MPSGTEHEADNRYLLKNLQCLPIAYKGLGERKILLLPRNCSAVSLGFQRRLSSVREVPTAPFPVTASQSLVAAGNKQRLKKSLRDEHKHVVWVLTPITN